MKKEEIKENELENIEENKQVNKTLEIIKKVFIILTSPIWFPWKLLFFRRKGRKFNEVNISTKVFRILRSPITKTLKFALFIGIIGLEIILLYKVRYSPVTYPITRSSVHNYYLNGNSNTTESSKYNTIENYKDDFKQIFGYIDKWDLNTKNKMYVVFDSDAAKIFFKYTDDKTVSYILNKFNNDEQFRENIKFIATNINNILSRIVRELPSESFNELEVLLGPIANIGSFATDYTVALDIAGRLGKWVIGEDNIQEKSITLEPSSLEQCIQVIIDFSKGEPLSNLFKIFNNNSNTTEITNITITSR